MHARCVTSWSSWQNRRVRARPSASTRRRGCGASTSTSGATKVGHRVNATVLDELEIGQESHRAEVEARPRPRASGLHHVVPIRETRLQSHLRGIGSLGCAGGFPAKTVTTYVPGCAAMRFTHPSLASSRCGETIAMRSSSPGARRGNRASAGDRRVGHNVGLAPNRRWSECFPTRHWREQVPSVPARDHRPPSDRPAAARLRRISVRARW